MKSFDKYYYYKNSVQAPEDDVQFLDETFQEVKKRRPKSLTEDFCGTFSICCEWVKLGDNKEAVGVDLDEEPIAYGKEHYMSDLSEDQRRRIKILNENVLNTDLPKTDIVSAFNFSYFIFKSREDLKSYFKSCYERVSEDGLLFIDNFGGGECMKPNEEVTDHGEFKYYWDQDTFDPVNNFAQFYIHFKVKGERKRREKVFSYDWRMWSIPELRDVLEEVGFKKVHVYWEGADKNGEGNGIFTPIQTSDEGESWVAYLVAEK